MAANMSQSRQQKQAKLLFFNFSSTLAYVTHEDVGRLQAFQEQTVIAIKAPEETKLEIPVPTEVRSCRRRLNNLFTPLS